MFFMDSKQQIQYIQDKKEFRFFTSCLSFVKTEKYKLYLTSSRLHYKHYFLLSMRTLLNVTLAEHTKCRYFKPSTHDASINVSI